MSCTWASASETSNSLAKSLVIALAGELQDLFFDGEIALRDAAIAFLRLLED